MTEKSETRIIEIDGVKLEIDLRTAKRVDTLRVGDRVRLLKDKTVHHGVVAGFEPFDELPTIVVAYLTDEWFGNNILKFEYYNSKTRAENKLEIVPSIDDDLPVERDYILRKFDREIEQARAKIDDLERRRKWFLENFGKYWGEES